MSVPTEFAVGSWSSISLNEFGVMDVSQPPVFPSGQYVVSVTLPQEPCEAPVTSLWTHPVVVLQESVVHGFPSLQLTAPPGLHTPPLHASGEPLVPVQALPSSQRVPSCFGVTVQLAVPLQLRVLHWSLVHVIAVPPHCPLASQVSL